MEYDCTKYLVEKTCYSRVPYWHGPIYHDITYSAGMTATERKSNFSSVSQQTPHTSPSWVSYGVSIMGILKKIDCILTTLHCIIFSCFNLLCLVMA